MRRAVVEALGVGVAWLLLAASGTAQQGGTGGLGTGTGGLGTGGLGTGTGTGGLGTGTSSAGSTGGLTGGTGGAGSGPFQLQQMMQAPTITPPTTTSNTALSSSNFLSPYYNNVLYQGSAINNQSGTSGGNPGGFGQPTFGTTGGAGGGSIGFAGSAGGSSRGGMTGSSRGGMTGSSRGGGLGGTFGNFGGGGLGGLGSTNLQSGVVIPRQTPNTYSMVAAFPNRPTPAPALQQQIQSLLARSTAISNPGAIEAVVSGEIVILRGTVADEEEARRLANMISLTPGVRQVRNEITISRLPVLDR